MTRSEFNARQLTLESRILNASYHAMKRGRFESAWRKLYDLTVDQLTSLIDERDERESTMSHVRQTAGYARHGAFGVYGGGK
jgi:hypothetical protein